MDDRVAALESRLAAVEQRLNVLEGAQPGLSTTIEDTPAPDLGDGFLSNASTLIGRVLLIFGGAYLLRAITDLNVVPTAFGIFLGASYALLWLFMAYRKGGNEDQRASAMFYGGASVFLALPLLAEAITRFALLSGPQGMVALALFCALALLVAVARNLRSLGWLVTAGGIVTAFVVLNASRAAVPVAAFLILLGLGSLWAVYLRQWIGPQWLGALGANAGIVVLLMISTSDQWSVEPLTPFLLGAVLLVTYLVSFALRSHVRGQNVGIFEALQAVVSVGIVFWTASIAAQVGQLALATVGVWCLVLGACAYGLAFTPETRSARGRNFYFHSTLGLALVVAGSALVQRPIRQGCPESAMYFPVARCRSGLRYSGDGFGGIRGRGLGRMAGFGSMACGHRADDSCLPFHSGGPAFRALGRPVRCAAADRLGAVGLGGGRTHGRLPGTGSGRCGRRRRQPSHPGGASDNCPVCSIGNPGAVQQIQAVA
jgi:hypothetical protein